MKPAFPKILIANRGEIACRIIRTTRRMGIATVAVYSDADAGALHVEMADQAVRIGPAPATESYLRGDAIIAAAQATGAVAIHPGYGFLSENPEFVEVVVAAGLVFIGPSARAIRAMGLKDAAKDLMAGAGVPVVPGYQGPDQDPDFLTAEAERTGFPILIKARAGGGGKGMRKVDRAADFRAALDSVIREGQAAFGDGRVLIEKYVTSPRHIEVQVFGDSHGNVVHLFERDCSLQRRHQKVIEEAPAPGMPDEMRAAMTDAAVRAACAIGYEGAGTVEFIVDGRGPLRLDGFWFMEMNTRLQVEHPVTEAITGIDLVEWQLRVAAGEPLPLEQEAIRITGHAAEARLYAEDPANGFLPATGRLAHLSFSDLARNDTGVRSGDQISPYYDPMIAKVITHGSDREDALSQLAAALRGTHVAGTATNAGFLARLADHPGFRAGRFDTGLIDRDLADLTVVAPASETSLAMAAIAGLGLDPGAPYFGWRLWDEAGHALRLRHRGELVERRLTLRPGGVTLTGGSGPLILTDVVREDGRITARALPTDARIAAEVVVAEVAGGHLISVLADGVAQDYLLPDARAGTAQAASMEDAIVAPMTGTVTLVDARPGAVVEEGARLLVMEAMKMETTLVAPRAGIVATVTCTAGATVEGGAVLVTFEPVA